MSKAKLARLPIAATVLLSSFGIAQCIPFAEANEQIGATRCITGKVLKVEEGQAGVTYLNFCEDCRSCPFTVVVFSSHLKTCRRRAGVEGQTHRSTRRRQAV